MSDYRYDAVVKAVHDGDTVTVDVDLGFDTWIHALKVRLYGLNAPELNTPEGKKSQAYLATLIPVGISVVIETQKDKQEKYGRWLATIFLNDANVNGKLIADGYAKPYFGVGPKPV
jgi:endonuclease YncB( thermonuclease family)